MKNLSIFSFLLLACSLVGTAQQYDDVYYIPSDQVESDFTTSDVTVDSEGDTYITNNYYGDADNDSRFRDDDYEYYYSSRIRRFHRRNNRQWNRGYYSNFYVDRYWYDQQDPFFWGNTIYYTPSYAYQVNYNRCGPGWNNIFVANYSPWHNRAVFRPNYYTYYSYGGGWGSPSNNYIFYNNVNQYYGYNNGFYGSNYYAGNGYYNGYNNGNNNVCRVGGNNNDEFLTTSTGNDYYGPRGNGGTRGSGVVTSVVQTSGNYETSFQNPEVANSSGGWQNVNVGNPNPTVPVQEAWYPGSVRTRDNVVQQGNASVGSGRTTPQVNNIKDSEEGKVYNGTSIREQRSRTNSVQQPSTTNVTERESVKGQGDKVVVKPNTTVNTPIKTETPVNVRPNDRVINQDIRQDEDRRKVQDAERQRQLRQMQDQEDRRQQQQADERQRQVDLQRAETQRQDQERRQRAEADQQRRQQEADRQRRDQERQVQEQQRRQQQEMQREREVQRERERQREAQQRDQQRQREAQQQRQRDNQQRSQPSRSRSSKPSTRPSGSSRSKSGNNSKGSSGRSSRRGG